MTDRQFCCVCLRTAAPGEYRTLEYPGGRRFHFCDRPACQDQYHEEAVELEGPPEEGPTCSICDGPPPGYPWPRPCPLEVSPDAHLEMDYEDRFEAELS